MKLSTKNVLVGGTIATFAFLFANAWDAINIDSINTRLGGVEAPADQAGRPCWYYERDQQLICYRTFVNWAGIKDAVPVYVIDHGKYIPLFD